MLFRSLVLRGGRPKQEHRSFAGLGADLQPANLLGAGLGQPGNQCAAGIALDQLFGAPQALSWPVGLDWELQVQVLKRRGSMHDGIVRLESIPGGLSAVLTPRLLQPSALIASRESFHVNPPEVAPHAVGGTAPSQRPRRHTTIR